MLGSFQNQDFSFISMTLDWVGGGAQHWVSRQRQLKGSFYSSPRGLTTALQSGLIITAKIFEVHSKFAETLLKCESCWNEMQRCFTALRSCEVEFVFGRLLETRSQGVLHAPNFSRPKSPPEVWALQLLALCFRHSVETSPPSSENLILQDLGHVGLDYEVILNCG